MKTNNILKGVPVFNGHSINELVQYQKMWRKLKRYAEGTVLAATLRNIESEYGMDGYSFNWQAAVNDTWQEYNSSHESEEKDYQELWDGVKDFAEAMIHDSKDISTSITFIIQLMIMTRVEKDGLDCLDELREGLLKKTREIVQKDD